MAKLLVSLAAMLCLTPSAWGASFCPAYWEFERFEAVARAQPTGGAVKFSQKDAEDFEVKASSLVAFADAFSKLRVLSSSVEIESGDKKVQIPAPNQHSFTFILCKGKDANAFAFPSNGRNYVAVTVGMVELIGADEDEAGLILGHELAHHIQGHGAQRRAIGTGLRLLGLVVGTAIQVAAGVPGRNVGGELGQLTGDVISRKFSRDHEREADQIGFAYAFEAGLDPAGAVRVAEKLGGRYGGGSSFLSSHPGWSERKETLAALAEKAKSRSGAIVVKTADGPERVEGGGAGDASPSPTRVLANQPKTPTEVLTYRVQAPDDLSHEEGQRFEYGIGAPIDMPKAAEIYRQCSAQGDPRCSYSLANLYDRGALGSRELDKAKDLFLLAQKQGHGHAEKRLMELVP